MINKPFSLNRHKLNRRIEAAQGKIDCDLILEGAQYLDVFTCEWRLGDIAIHEGSIVGLLPGLKSKRKVNARGKWVVPGFVDAHVHVESSLLLPHSFQNAVLARGTTSAICDPHELANVQGVAGIQYFLDSASRLEMDLWIMLSSCVPATHLETNGGGVITAEALAPLASHPRALGLAEVMNMPGVLNGSEDVLDKLISFQNDPIDGHCPLLKGHALAAYAAAGISSCHESSELSEAREKLTQGIAIWIREGSVAKDLDALIPLLTMATSTSIGFCTDDRNPLDILTEGHIDYLVRQAIKKGVPAPVAYRSASWSVARHYGLDTGPNKIGAVAPGYAADLVVLADHDSCDIDAVLKNGAWAAEIVAGVGPYTSSATSVFAHVPQAEELKGPSGKVHVINVLQGKILTGRSVLAHDAPGVARLSVLERHGKHSPPANAYVHGFGTDFRGAIASSVGHDSHNLIVVGSNLEDMRIALASLIECGGGFSVVQEGCLIERLPLPIGGLMSREDPQSLKNILLKLKAASLKIGCELPEPFLQLAFLSLPVIPSLKLTDRGLVDVNAFRIIDPRA